jgi:hypothetical protein
VLYRTAGRLADVVMANSSWTKAHLDALWGLHAGGASVVFPPCNTENFKVTCACSRVVISLRASVRRVACPGVTVGWSEARHHFCRPVSAGEGPREATSCICSFEAHGYAWRAAQRVDRLVHGACAHVLADPKAFNDVQLIMLGGARDADDLARVEALRNLALSLDIQVCVLRVRGLCWLRITLTACLCSLCLFCTEKCTVRARVFVSFYPS